MIRTDPPHRQCSQEICAYCSSPSMRWAMAAWTAQDGNHSPYHYEMKTILSGLFDKLSVANAYDALFTDPGVDFVWPMLNRGGFL